MCCHRTELHLQQNHANHHDDRQDCVEVVGNRTDKQCQTILTLYKAADCSRPGRDRCDNADRCSRGVDQICQLRAGNIVLVRHRPHHAAHGQTVKVIIDKDQHTQQDGRELCTHTGLDMLSCPASERCRTARLVHQGNHRSEQYKEDQDTHIVGIRQYSDQSAVKGM